MSYKTWSYQTWVGLVAAALLAGALSGYCGGQFTMQRYVLRPPVPGVVPISIVVDQTGKTVQPVPLRAYAYRGQKVEWYVPSGELLNIDWKQGQNPSGLADPKCGQDAMRPGAWTCTVDVPRNAPYGTNRYTVMLNIGGATLQLDPEVVIEG